MKKQEISFKITEEQESKKNDDQALNGMETDDSLTALDRQKADALHAEFLMESPDGAILEVKNVSADGRVTSVTMEEIGQTIGFDEANRMSFGDQSVLCVSSPLDPSASEKRKEILETQKQDYLQEHGVKDEQYVDLALILDDYFTKVQQNRGVRSTADFNAYIEKCSINVLKEEVPQYVIEIAADMDRIKYNPRPEFNKVREFLKSMYGITFQGAELDNYIKNHQLLMDIGSFCQDAGLDAADFLQNKSNFDAMKKEIKEKLAPGAVDEESFSINKDILNKYAQYISFRHVYENLSDTCVHMSRLIKDMPLQELRDYVAEAFILFNDVKTQFAAKWSSYEISNGPLMKNFQNVDVPNPTFNLEDYKAKKEEHAIELAKALTEVYLPYYEVFGISAKDDLYKIVSTLHNDMSIALLSEDFEVEKAQLAISSKHVKVLQEIDFCNSYIDFIPTIVDMSRVRKAVDKLKDKQAFIKKTRKISDLEDRAKSYLKELKKSKLTLAIAGLKDGRNLNEIYVGVKERLTTVYTEATKHFMINDETRTIPVMDMRVLTAAYISIIFMVFEQAVEEAYEKHKLIDPADGLALQLSHKIMESQITELSNFLAFSQMLDTNSIYELLCLFNEYGNEFEFSGKDYKPLIIEIEDEEEFDDEEDN